ncbi:phytoene dehydrogenase-like protein [Caldalkalibacillus uzonensis]|uniref:Phytoene dehydrogenase-like protein n=1 Tax=Caldalkalibacillus uzonensis TaxID=353224 RepID=A0ABU0CMX9_9BACI|nr:phytoene dehydrogenase-like protein [Caldalkalibacillus uzonensis]
MKGTLVDRGRTFRLPLTPLSLLSTSYFTWKEKKEMIRLILLLPKIAAKVAENENLQSWAEREISSPRVRDYVYCLCRLSTYCSNPELVTARIVLEQLKLSMHGVLYVNGGWQQIVDGLAKRAMQSGATILNQHQVTSINGAYPEITVGVLNDKVITTKHVLSTISPAHTYELLPAKEKEALTVLNQFKPVFGASLDIVFNQLPSPRISFALCIDQSLYFSNHSSGAKLGRHKHQMVVHVYKYLDVNEEYEPVKIKKELEAFLDLLQPGWQKEVITSRFLPRMLVSHALPDNNTKERLNELQVLDRVLPGLYVAGDWLSDKYMLADAALSSAKQAALSIIKDSTRRGGVVYRHSGTL